MIFFLLLLLVSCQEPKEPLKTFSGVAMTIPYTIHVGKKISAEEGVEINKIIEETFERIDRIFNKWNPNSEVSFLNRLKKLEKVKISLELEELLKTTEEVVLLSQGRFDPTIEALQQLWKKSLQEKKEPNPNDLQRLAPAIGWKNIHIQEHSFFKDHDDTQMDLGGIAKGYAVDLLVKTLEEHGFSPCFVEWGGEIRATGAHPQGRPWTIFVSRFGDPREEHAITHLTLDNRGVATSGDYHQSYLCGEKRYSHIYDKNSLAPLRAEKCGIASATVIAPTCTLADALATCCYLFDSAEECLKWANSVQEANPSIQFILAARP
jgi:thiamine biosynthesis lipoprotein